MVFKVFFVMLDTHAVRFHLVTFGKVVVFGKKSKFREKKIPKFRDVTGENMH